MKIGFLGLFFLIFGSVAQGEESWYTRPATCSESADSFNPACYQGLISTRYTHSSDQKRSGFDTLFRAYYGLPIGNLNKFHLEISREFESKPGTTNELQKPTANSQIHLLSIDNYDLLDDISFMFGVQKPAFGADHQIIESQDAFNRGLLVFGQLINGLTITVPGRVFDNFTASLGQVSNTNPIELKPKKPTHLLSFQYIRTTSLLYRTNFYISSLITDDGVRKFGLALMQIDYKKSSTTLEFVRTGSIKDQTTQDFRLSHVGQKQSNSRSRLQWDWGWKRYAKFSYFHVEKLLSNTYLEVEFSHLTDRKLDIPALWQLGLNLKAIF